MKVTANLQKKHTKNKTRNKSKAKQNKAKKKYLICIFQSKFILMLHNI